MPGVAKPTTTSGSDTNQTFLRTRLLIPPVLDEQAQSYSTASTIPDTLPGAGCVTAFGNGVGPATQPGFTPAAGGHVVAPSAQEADVEVASATPVGQVASASYQRAGRPRGPAAWRSAGWWSRPCSWRGAPAPRVGARAGGPERCPGAPPWRAGSSDTRRENGES